MKHRVLLLLLILHINGLAMAQEEILGRWKTVDDKTGEARSIVEIFRENGKFYGKVVEILNPQKVNEICQKCEKDDPRWNQKILGMEIITGLEKEGNAWDGGHILDPLKGKVYKCKVWIEKGRLMVRGYIGYSFIGRTQIWEPT